MYRRCWLALGLALAALPCPAFSAPLAATPIARLDLPWWRARFDEKQAAIRDAEKRGAPFDVVYYGDSITQNFERTGTLKQAGWASVWQHYYGDRHALNLGFKGDTTANLLWRIEHGEGDLRAPKVAIMLIGANNLGRLHWSAADTLAGIDADVAAIRRHLPHARILLIGILPSVRSAWVDETTRTVNAGLAQRYGHAPGERDKNGERDGDVVFVDAGRVLMKDGRADPGLFIDPLLTPPDPPLHPTAEGQAMVAAAIEPTLARMLGDRQH